MGNGAKRALAVGLIAVAGGLARCAALGERALAALGRGLDWLVFALVRLLARLTAAVRLGAGRPAVLWASTPILTHPLLARCVRALGWRSDSLAFQTYYIGADFDLNLSDAERWFRRRPRRVHAAFRRTVLYWAILSYDVFHYFHDQGLLATDTREGVSEVELTMLRKAGKRVYLAAYGADVRTRAATQALGDPNCCTFCPAPGRFCVCDDLVQVPLMQRRAALVTARMTTAEMGVYDPGARSIRYWPLDCARIVAAPPPPRSGPLRLVHAPNHPEFKGTVLLRGAVERLRARGVEIDYQEISKLPNTEVLARMTQADLVADQFVIGAHGYTALEAMALGRPVLCFLRGDQGQDPPPIIQAAPDALEAVLEACATGQLDLAEIGRRSRAWVERHHDIPAVADELAAFYLETGGWNGAVERSLRRRQAR